MDYQVVLSHSARADLRSIVRYISADAPDRAVRFGMLLISRTRILGSFPELGRLVPEFEDPSIREIIVHRIIVSSIELTTLSIWSKLFAFGTLPAAFRKLIYDLALVAKDVRDL